MDERLRDEPEHRPALGGHVRRRDHAHVDVLPDAVHVSVEYRDERAARGKEARNVLRLFAEGTHRRERVVVVPVVPHHTPLGEDGEVGHGGVHVDAATEGRDGDPDQRGGLGAEFLVVEPELRQATGVLSLEHDVGAPRQCPEVGGALGGLEVEHDAALGRVVVPPPEARVGTGGTVDERPEPARRVTSGRFDDDHIGAEVGEQLPGVGRARTRELDDAQTFEHRFHLR